MTGTASNPKCIRLPDRGRLLCAANLRGNLRDFTAVIARFEAEPDACLLLLGNLIHGPYLPASEWQPDLGSYYRDESPALLLRFLLLRDKHPGRVFALLGNHEYGHLGGPHTARFAADETAALEARLGGEGAAYVAQCLRELPLWAVSPAGLLFCHAAPGATLGSLAELEAIDPADAGRRALLGQMLWSSSLSPQRARRLLALAGARLLVHGHDVVAGYEKIGQEQIILDSSFGLRDEQKRLLSIDLEASYHSVADLKEGSEIIPVYS